MKAIVYLNSNQHILCDCQSDIENALDLLPEAKIFYCIDSLDTEALSAESMEDFRNGINNEIDSLELLIQTIEVQIENLEADLILGN